VDVSRHGEVDHEQRAPVSLRHHLVELLALDHMMRRTGRGDDDVGAGHLVGECLEADGAAAEAIGQPDRAVVVAVGDEDRVQPLGRERSRRELGGLPGPDDEHAAGLELAEGSLRELDRDRRDRHRPRRDPGLRPRALAGGEGGAEDAVEDGPRRALDEGELVRPLHLALDLGLADDHRVEAGRDAEQVLGSMDAPHRVQVPDERGRLGVGLPR
jgi:hypothetical protein